MSQTSAKTGLHRAILKQLAHPLKLKAILCSAMLAVWYSAFFSPLSDRVSATTARIAVERKRVGLAREVGRLKKSLAPYRDVVAWIDVHELMRHMMHHIQSSPLRLIDLKPERPKDLGPYESIGLKLSLEGAYSDIDEFLHWAEKDKRMLRIDSIQLRPNSREPGRLSAMITLLALAEKAPAPSAGATKAKAEKKP